MAPDKRRGKGRQSKRGAPPELASAPSSQTWTVEVWEDDHGRAPFVDWFAKLDQYEQAVVDAVINQILLPLGIDVCSTEWGKALGDGLYEVRIRRPLSTIRTWGKSGALATDLPDRQRAEGEHDEGRQEEQQEPADRSVMLRIFCTFHGSRVVLLFQGYDKGADASDKRQQREISAARRSLRAWREQERRRR